MKVKTVLLMMIALFLLGGMGCEKKENLPEYYTGKVTMLGINDIDMQKQLGVILIQKSIPNGLRINSAIAFDELSLGRDLKVGDILNFTITTATGWQFTNGLFPESYVLYAEIKLYN